MTSSEYLVAAEKRIAHIKGHLVAMESNTVGPASRNVRNRTGSPKGSAMRLSSHALACAMDSWFDKQDLARLRQWAYVAARLDKFVYQLDTEKSQGGGMLGLLAPLLSNERSTIEWFANYDEPFYLDRVDDHRTFDHLAYQAKLALRGEWRLLAERCKRAIADPPRSSSLQKYVDDYDFYLALADGDKTGMEAALLDMVQPRKVRGRSNDDCGFTADLISTAAVIYAKIAGLHGHELRVDSPYVPAAWLANTPLERYDDHYDFLK